MPHTLEIAWVLVISQPIDYSGRCNVTSGAKSKKRIWLLFLLAGILLEPSHRVLRKAKLPQGEAHLERN